MNTKKLFYWFCPLSLLAEIIYPIEYRRNRHSREVASGLEQTQPVKFSVWRKIIQTCDTALCLVVGFLILVAAIPCCLLLSVIATTNFLLCIWHEAKLIEWRSFTRKDQKPTE